MAAYVYISAVLKCALVSTMPAASTLQRRGVTLSTLWVWYELMTLLEIDNLLIVSCISVFDMNWWDLWSGVEDCSSPSVWCKETQRRHCCDDHLKSCWWGFLVESSTKLLVSSFTISTLEASRRQNKTILFSFADLQHPYVSPACFPSCQQQFDHVFSNGTGARFRLSHHLHNCLDLQQLF